MSSENGKDRMGKRVQGRLHGYRRDSGDFKTRRLLKGFRVILLFDVPRSISQSYQGRQLPTYYTVAFKCTLVRAKWGLGSLSRIPQ